MPGHYITDLTLENIEIELSGTGIADNARHSVPEAIDQYPEVKTFGPLIPAYGVWARHVKGLKLKNLTFRLKNNDLRPAIICEDGRDIEISNCNIPVTNGAQSIVRLENVNGAIIHDNKVEGKADAFVRAEGTNSTTIQVSQNSIPGIKKKIESVAAVKKEVAVSNQ